MIRVAMGHVCMSNVFLFNVIMSSELYVILSNSCHMFNASQRWRRTWCTQFSIEQDTFQYFVKHCLTKKNPLGSRRRRTTQV